MQGNNIPSLNSEMFAGIAENVQTLYLTTSKIQWIVENTFSNFKSLQFLFMQFNLLTTLPVGVFDNLLEIPNLLVTVQNNKWHCECSLFYLQKVIKEKRGNLVGNVTCATPEKFKDIEIITLELCEELEDTTIAFSSHSETVGLCDGHHGGLGCEPTNEITSGKFFV